MKMKIKLKLGAVTAVAQLNDTPTTQKLLDALPFDSTAQTWGDEVYFEAPLSATLEGDAQQVVDPGTLGFWTQGNCLAIPFGPTPISKGDECRLADKVNLVGKLEGDPRQLAAVQPGDTIRVEVLND
jgi:hypothetical protein